MFLPTKAHDPLIADKQYKLRLGSRVPDDAVNLAYTYVPALKATENVQVTDVAGSIVENARNENIQDMIVMPTDSLILKTEDGQVQLPTEEILMTNVFHESLPMYYAHTLSYYHFDKKGPDRYRMYQGDGITIVNESGTKIDRPYRIQLIPHPSLSDFYTVNVFVAIKDAESDSYAVVYNASEISAEGVVTTKAGYKEGLSLRPAFHEAEKLTDILLSVNNTDAISRYYKGNGASPGYSKFYVPEKATIDKRHREYFKYQVSVEMDYLSRTYLYTTPWMTGEVMNAASIFDEDKHEYVNGNKKMREETAEELIREIINTAAFTHGNAIKKFYVKTNNPLVKVFTRLDGAGPIYASTAVKNQQEIALPTKSKQVKFPINHSGNASFRVRPIKADVNDIQHISFMIDHSASMGQRDPGQTMRYSIVKDLINSAKEFYYNVKLKGSTFAYGQDSFQNSFTLNSDYFLELYKARKDDKDITKTADALIAANNSFGGLSSGSSKKSIILITDGVFENDEEETKFYQAVHAAHVAGNHLGIITFSNVQRIQSKVAAYNCIVLNALSQQLTFELKTFYFDVLGSQNSTSLMTNIDFTTSPLENDKQLIRFSSSTPLPPSIHQNPERFGIELVLTGPNSMTGYFLDANDNKKAQLYNGRSIISGSDMFSLGKKFDVMITSVNYETRFLPIYSIRFNDTQQIKVLPPNEQHSNSSWYLRVKNGRFAQQKLDEKDNEYFRTYGIPEYYQQSFDKEKGLPYMSVTAEKPVFLDETQIQVTNRPLYIEYNKEQPVNARVLVNGAPIKIKSHKSFDGVIELASQITENDDITVDYQYEEDSYTYRGYYDEESGSFIMLDLNPGVGHFSTIKDVSTGEIKELPSFTLINKTIYLYMRNISKLVSSTNGDFKNVGDIKNRVLFHTFETIENQEDVQLIGEIRVRPNSNKESLQMIDTRVRGGGLKEEITEALMQEFEKESFYYWDIGYWDGIPYSENAVVTINISKRVLKEHGGQFTKEQVEEKINKHLGYGVFPIIEFKDESSYLLETPRNLHADVFDVNDDGSITIERPTFEVMGVNHNA